MANKKTKSTLYTVFGKIGDIILIPVIFLALTVCLLIFFQGRQDNMPSVFGISIVRIMSGSMQKSGFDIGDSVIIKKTNTDELWIGDIIAFFQKDDPADKGKKLTLLSTVNQQPVVTKPIPQERLTIDDLKGTGMRVIFHEIKNVYYDETGTRFFQTKGSSNDDFDTVKVREDFVLGKYVSTPNWVRDALKWLATPTGMIVCVCLPLGILVILEALSLIEQINFMYIEKKLLKGEMHWEDREAKRLIKTGDMEEICKIIYFSKVDEAEREELADNLWIFKTNLSKKQLIYKEKVKQAIKILNEKGKREYLLFWKNNLKWKWDIKQIDQELTYLIYAERVGLK